MSSNDRPSVRRLLDSVLAEFEVTSKWTRQTPHELTAEIWVRDKRLVYTFTHVNEHSVTNCQSDLRLKLVTFGAVLKQPRVPNLRPAYGEVPLSIPVAAEPSQRAGLMNSTATINPIPAKVTIETTPEPDPPDPVDEPEIPEPDIEKVRPSAMIPEETTSVSEPVEEVSIAPSQPAKPDESQTVMLTPTEVMVIELDHDLTVPMGHVLVIPLHNPKLLLDMPKTQYLAFFREVERIVTPEQPAVTRTVDAEPEVVPDRKRKPRATTPPVRTPYVMRRDEEITPETRMIEGISAQVGRQMLAIAHVQQHINHGRPVSVAELAGFLDQRDHKQVSARMPAVWKMGYANRVESSGGRPLQYSINATGLQLLKRLRTWPWTRENLPIPAWVE